jgi:hypothetical protein
MAGLVVCAVTDSSLFVYQFIQHNLLCGIADVVHPLGQIIWYVALWASVTPWRCAICFTNSGSIVSACVSVSARQQSTSSVADAVPDIRVPRGSSAGFIRAPIPFWKYFRRQVYMLALLLPISSEIDFTSSPHSKQR